ncbi:pseudouridine-5'-phosphate glycosidase [Yinghuangia aomiensis]
MPYPQRCRDGHRGRGHHPRARRSPATIAVLGGWPASGLTPDDLELLATAPDVAKASVRDLPYVMARGAHGATTVAATMRLAALAGIRVFVTGGLGGVHRGAPQEASTSAPTSSNSRRPTWPWSAPG